MNSTTKVDDWLRAVDKVRTAFEQSGISVLGHTKKVDALTQLIVRIVPNRGKRSYWAAHVETASWGERYVMSVRCRVCGHTLRINQSAWQWRHEWQHKQKEAR